VEVVVERWGIRFITEQLWSDTYVGHLQAILSTLQALCARANSASNHRGMGISDRLQAIGPITEGG